PLHYPFLMVWYRIVGDDPEDFRLFGVFIFLLTLPFLFLLSQKLFNLKLAGWIAISLYAVSPFIHLFAQEARYYILWSFIIIVLHYLLLQAREHNNLKWWAAYSLVATLSLYASPVSGIIILGHISFIWITRKDLLKNFVISISLGFFIYLPWTVWLYFNLNEIFSALSWHSNPQQQVTFWFPLLGQLFYLFSIFSSPIDFFYVFDQASKNIPPEANIAFTLNFMVLALIITAFIFLIRKIARETKYFLLLIILPGLLFFYILDLVRSGLTSWWWRYLLFIAPGIILVMTNYLYKKIEKGKLIHASMYLIIAVIGIISLFNISKTKHWFLGRKWDCYIQDARLFSNASKPLLITDFAFNHGMINSMVAILECNSGNIDILRASPDIEIVEKMINHQEYSDIYVFHASDELIGNLKSQFGVKMDSLNVVGTSSIWKINIDNNP
ncbi:MAG: glycosyltransferase family 39 protein, partial [Calditrichota bacterium]